MHCFKICTKVGPSFEIPEGSPVYRDIKANQTHRLEEYMYYVCFSWNTSVLWVVLSWFPIAPFDTGTQVALSEREQSHGHVWRPDMPEINCSFEDLCHAFPTQGISQTNTERPFRKEYSNRALKPKNRNVHTGIFWSIERFKVWYSLSRLPVDHQSRTLPRCCLSPCVAPSIQNQPKNHSLNETDPEILSIAALASITVTLWFIDDLVIWTPKECQKATGRQSHGSPKPPVSPRLQNRFTS